MEVKYKGEEDIMGKLELLALSKFYFSQNVF